MLLLDEGYLFKTWEEFIGFVASEDEPDG